MVNSVNPGVIQEERLNKRPRCEGGGGEGVSGERSRGKMEGGKMDGAIEDICLVHCESN